MRNIALFLLLFVTILSVDCFANTGEPVTQNYDLKYELKAGQDTGAIYKILWDSILSKVDENYFEIVDYICSDKSECKITIRYIDKSDQFNSQYFEVKVKNSEAAGSSVEILSSGKVFNKYALLAYQKVSSV